VFGFSKSVLFHECSVLVFVLLLPEDKRIKPDNLPKSSAHPEIGELGWRGRTITVVFEGLTALYCLEKLKTRPETANTNCVAVEMRLLMWRVANLSSL
jgi:hypothetical protein